MKPIEWTTTALADPASLDRAVARRVNQAVERFAVSGAGDVRRLQGVDPPELRLRVGDWRVRFRLAGGILRVVRILHRREAYR